MENVEFLEAARIERIGRKIRGELAILRRRKLLLSSTNARPPRNPALDSLLGQLQLLRVRLDLLMRKLEADEAADAVKIPVLARAREILGGAGEMIDLLVWLGAEMPIEPDVIGDSASCARSR